MIDPDANILPRIYYLQKFKDENHLNFFDAEKGRWLEVRLDVSNNSIQHYFTKVVQISNRYVLICGGTDNNNFSERYLDPPSDIYKVDLT